MRKRVLMSSVAATVVASMMMFTGCGSSNSSSSTPVAAASETRVQPAADNSAANAAAAAQSATQAQAAAAEAAAAAKKFEVIGDKTRVECEGGVKALSEDACPQEVADAPSFVSDPAFFRSLMGSMYEAMNVPFSAYDPAILKALEKATMTEFIAELTGFKYSDAKTGATGISFNAAPWRVSLVTNAVQTLTSNASNDAKAVVLAAIDGYIKMGSKGLADDDQNSSGVVVTGTTAYDTNHTANYADADHFANIFTVNHLFAIEKFILDNASINGGIDSRALAIKLITEEFGFNTQNVIVDNTANPVAPATGLKVSKCAVTPLVECGPRVSLFTADGDIKGDDKNNSQYSFTNIDSICESSFSKYDVNSENVEAGMPIEVALFANEQKYVRLDKAGKLSSVNDQFKAIESYLTNALSIELAPKIDAGMRGLDENYTTTLVLDFPDACTDGDVAKQEYLTLSFISNFKVDANGEWNVTMEADENNNTLQDILVTGRIYDATSDSYEQFNLAAHLPADYPLTTNHNGAITINPIDLMSKVIKLDNTAGGIATDVYLPKIKGLLVRKFTNEGTYIAKLSMIKDLNRTAVAQLDSNRTLIKEINALANNQITDANKTALAKANADIAKLKKVLGGTNFISNTGVLNPADYVLTKKADNMFIDDDYRALVDSKINAVVVKTCLN